MDEMRESHDRHGTLSTVSLTAPTGSGKTIIAAAVAEGLFHGNRDFNGDDDAAILWLSDSPSLNEQTRKRFIAATDLINGATAMETIDPDFAKDHERLERLHIYFLNRQLLSTSGRLSNVAEGGRTFYDVLTATIEDPDTHLFCFIDEAHRGLGRSGTSEGENQTIYAKLIDGQDGINPPMPIVVGISATPERFNEAMAGRQDRDTKAPVAVCVDDVRASGLIKDTIELRTPKTASDTQHQDLTQACGRLENMSDTWRDYCAEQGITPPVEPLMVVQVEDRISDEMLGKLCQQIRHALPWLDASECFANVFGRHEDITTPFGTIAYCPPEDVAEYSEIRILFAKDAISTGWDCPRAEVIYSRRTRRDSTYIAQLIGRMIRTPLQQHIDSVDELNTVTCYLPEYDEQAVESVVAALRHESTPIGEDGTVVNPVHTFWFGDVVTEARAKLDAAGITYDDADENIDAGNVDKPHGFIGQSDNSDTDDSVVANTDTNESTSHTVATTSVKASTAQLEPQVAEQLQQTIENTPRVDSTDIKASFEGIITRQVRHDSPNIFLNLWRCIDIITQNIDADANLNNRITDDLYDTIEYAISRHAAEFKRTHQEIISTTMIIKQIDPLTGKEYANQEELAQNDNDRLNAAYEQAVKVFASSDAVKTYINTYRDENDTNDNTAIGRISAVAACLEVMRYLEDWADRKIKALLDQYGDNECAITKQEQIAAWNDIKGTVLPYVEQNLITSAIRTLQSSDDTSPWPKHIICNNADGLAYFKFNDLERTILRTEIANPLNVAWYRNPPTGSRASLAIPYQDNGEWKSMYPDFIFFRRRSNGTIFRTIVDPHGDWLADSVAKLKGYVEYLQDHNDLFGNVLAVSGEKNDVYRKLNLKEAGVQQAIRDFTGSSARELFTGSLSQTYVVQPEKKS